MTLLVSDEPRQAARSEVNPLITRIYRTGHVEDADGSAIDAFGPSVPYATGRLLYDLILREGLDSTLEVGMAYGLSTLFICQAHQDKNTGRHTAIDPFQKEWKSIGLLNVERAGLNDRFRFIPAPSSKALASLCESNERIDFAFIDGAHRFDQVLMDFHFIDQILKVAGFIAMDDLGMPSVRKVVSFILRNRSYEPVAIASGDGGPVWKRVARAGYRLLQDPFTELCFGVPWWAGNVLVLRKTAWDNRAWDHYRGF
jgi:predicted O-methyltransferase YrrM